MTDWTRPTVGAVLRLHAPIDLPEQAATVCVECRQAYPCRTVQTIREHDPLADHG